MPLLIEAVQPQLVGGIDTLWARLAAEGQARGLSKDQSDAVIAMLPPNLAACGCFLDRLTGIWRYEFGLPHRVGNQLIWGVCAAFDGPYCPRCGNSLTDAPGTAGAVRSRCSRPGLAVWLVRMGAGVALSLALHDPAGLLIF